MPGLQERELANPGAGGERLIAITVLALEQAELSAGVGMFAAHDDSHAVRPAAQIQQSGDLGDIGMLADLPVGGDRRRPRRLGTQTGPRS